MSCGFGLRTGDFMIRVLHVVGRMDYGGAENRLLELARVTDPSGIYFDFCVLQDGPGAYANEIVKLGFGIVKCKLTKNVPGFIRRFRHLLRQGNYDAIHCHVYQFSGLPLRLAAKEKVPIRIIPKTYDRLGRTVCDKNRSCFGISNDFIYGFTVER